MSTRKIKDAKDLVTNELIYFKGHARATFMSDGKTVEEAINGINNGGGGGIIAETDPIFSASPAASITEEKKAEWDNKMGKVTLAKVATSGSYNDLTNKPTIPAAVTETTVTGWGFTKNTGTYSKPSGGIPKTDLAPAVQTSLDSVESKLDKPIVFDAAAIDYDVNVAATEITAEQIQTATGMTSEELYDAVIAGRKVTLSLGGVYGSYELCAIQDFNGFAYLSFGFVTLFFSVIIIRGGGGSIEQTIPFDDYYMKNEVDEKIASAITSTLNTAV